ncbi:MAG TPA: hypothetical protein VN043_16530 [Rhodanobacter sp.]|nr:hypothetical protein [Rhodanobacter sp.]
MIDSLQFGNGLVLARDESFIVVAEANASRLLCCCEGRPAGSIRRVAALSGQSLDGCRRTVWVALASPHHVLLDNPPRLRRDCASWLRACPSG